MCRRFYDTKCLQIKLTDSEPCLLKQIVHSPKMAGMQDYDPMLSFGDEVAALYDDELRGDEADAVRFLSRLAGDGRALELAVGTGRIALPLAAAGVGVDGIDLSDAMVAKLRSKPGGEAWT